MKMALQDLNGKVKIHGQLAEAFGTERRLTQGNSLSTALFSVVLEKVIKNIETNPTGTIFNRTKQYIAYAVDVLMLGRWVRTTDETVTQTKEAAVSNGLVINDTKQVHENKQKYNKFRARSDKGRTDMCLKAFGILDIWVPEQIKNF
jgi:hypothetical protein